MFYIANQQNVHFAWGVVILVVRSAYSLNRSSDWIMVFLAWYPEEKNETDDFWCIERS